MKPLILLFFVILSIFCQSLYAQTITNTLYTGSTPNPLTCSANQFSVVVDVPVGTLVSTVDLTINIPAGAVLTSSSGTVSGNVITGIPITLPTTTIIYELYFPCSMIPPLQVSGSYTPISRTDELTLSWSTGSNLPVNFTYLIDYPILVPTVVGGTQYSAPGLTVTRSIEITNTGTGVFNGTINFLDYLPCSAVNISNIVVTQGPFTFPPFTSMPPTGIEFPVTGLAPYSTIIITETIDYEGCVNPANGCLNSVAQSTFTISSGCSNPLDLCVVNSNLGASILRNTNAPLVKLFRILPQDVSPTTPYPFEPICPKPAAQIALNNPADFHTRQFKFVNLGNATAFDVHVDLRENSGNVIPFPKNDIVLFDKVTAIHLDASGAPISTANSPVLVTFTYPSASIIAASECLTEAQNNGSSLPISNMIWNFPELKPGESVIFEYKIFRCCPSDAKFNDPVYFDTWAVDPATGYFYANECGAAAANVIPSTVAADLLNVPGSYLPVPPDEKAVGINMSQINLTPVSDLSGISNTCNAAGAETFEIYTTSFNSLTGSLQGIEQLFASAPGGAMPGEIRIDIVLEQGLATADNTVSLTNPGSSFTPILIPSPSNQSYSGASTATWSYTLDLSQFSNLSQLQNFLIYSTFKFNLTPCCPSLGDGPAEFKVEWYYNPMFINCPTCWIPLSRVKKKLNVHCPGCVTPGVIVDEMDIVRKTFGWVDADNNGLADGSGTLLTDAPVQFPSSKYSAMPGDVIKLTAGSFFQDGDCAGGFNYAAMLANVNPLTCLYVDINTQCARTDRFNWDPINETIVIEGIPINLSTYAVTQSVTQADGQFFYRIPLASVPELSSYTLSTGDEFDVEIDFSICGNWETGPEVEPCDVDIRMWLSADNNMPPNAFENVQTAPETNQITATTSCINQAAAVGPNLIYYCEAFARTINIYRTYSSTTAYWSNQGQVFWGGLETCRKTLLHVTQARLGSTPLTEVGQVSTRNFFKYEYRPIKYELANINFQMPPNYQLAGTSLESYIPIYDANNSTYRRRIITDDNPAASAAITVASGFGNFTFNGGFSNVYDIAKQDYAYPYNCGGFLTGINLAPVQGLYVLPACPTIPLLQGDESFQQVTNIFVKPELGCSAPATQDLTGFTVTTAINEQGCSNPLVSETETFTSGQLRKPTTLMQLQSLENPVYVQELQPECFTFQLSSILVPGNYSVASEFVYFYIPTIPGMTITSVVANGGPGVNLVDGVYTIPGFMQSSQILSFTVCFNITDCSLTAFDLPIIYGYGCDGYPTALTVNDPLLNCFQNTALIPISPLPIGLNLDMAYTMQETSMMNCETVTYKACTNVTQPGDININQFTITVPNGAQVVPGSVVLSSGSSTVVNPGFTFMAGQSGNTYTYNLIQNWPLTIFDNLDENICVTFHMVFNPACSSTVGDAPSIQFNGIPYCGGTISANFTFNDIPVTGSLCPPITASASIIDASCAGGDGSIVVTANGVAPLSYAWSSILGPVGTNSPVISGLVAGTYTLIIMDGNGCQNSYTYTILDEGAVPLVVSGVVTNETCGNNNGAINISVSGGTPIYNIAWSPSGLNPTPMGVNNLSAGNYSVTVTDGNGCIETANFTVIDENPLVSDVATVSPTCGLNNGSISVLVSGGSGNYSYSWTGNGSNTNTATGLSSGSFSVDVIDVVTGCDLSLSFTLSGVQPLVLTGSVINPNCGSIDGSIDLTVSGGTAPFDYSWNIAPPNDTEDLYDLAAGTYTVVVTDAEECLSTITFELVDQNALAVESNVVDAICGAPTGAIELIVTGGSGNYSYSWSPNAGGQTSSTIIGLTTDLYSVLVTDLSSGCTFFQNFTVGAVNNLAVTGIVTNADCNQNGGAIDVTVTGGSGDFTYAWSSTSQTVQDPTGLIPTTYTLVVTDNLTLCTSQQTFVVGTEEPLSVAATYLPSCPNSCDGSILISVNGGSGVYTSSWSGAIGANTVFSNNSVTGGCGTYDLSLVDSEGCMYSGLFTIPEQTITMDFTAIVSQTDPCFLTFQPTIDLNGYIPDSWTWDFGDGSFASGLGMPTSESHVFGYSGYYMVCLEVRTLHGDDSYCTHTFCQEILVKGPCKYDSNELGLGVNLSNLDDLIVVPNPSNGVFTLNYIDGSTRPNHTVIIRDLRGVELSRESFRGDEELRFDLSDSPKGVYLIIADNGTTIYHKKVVIN